MRRAKWARAKCYFRRQHTSHRVYGDHFESLFLAEIRENRRQPTGQHRLACTRRPDENEIVRTGGCNFKRALCTLLTHNVGEVHFICARRFDRLGRASNREIVPAQLQNQLSQCDWCGQ